MDRDTLKANIAKLYENGVDDEAVQAYIKANPVGVASAIPTDTRAAMQSFNNEGMDSNIAPSGLAASLPGYGKAISGMLPVTGTAGLLGKELEFNDPDSPLPTGVNDTPTIFANLKDKKYGAAALQGLGVLPDVGYAATALKSAKALPGIMRSAADARSKVPLASDRVANPLVKPGQVAVDEIQSAFKAGKITPQELEAQLSELGDSAVPADIPAFANLHAKVARTPGAAGEKAASVLTARDAATPARLNSIIGDTVSNQPFHETQEALKAVGKNATAPLYERAYASKTPVYDDEVGRMMADPKVSKNLRTAVENAMSKATGRGEKADLSDWAITDWDADGNPIMSGVPNMRTLHAAREAMDSQLYKPANMIPNTNKLNMKDPNVQALSSLRSGLTRKMQQLGEKNPDTGVSLIKEADAEHERYQKLNEALETGYDSLKNDPEINKRLVEGSPEYKMQPMTDEQREMAQRGLARNLMEQVTSKGKAAIDLFQNEDTLNRMRPLFESQKDFDKFKLGITAEARMAKTGAAGDVANAAKRTGADVSNLGEPSKATEAVGTAADLATSSKLGKLKRAGLWVANKFEPEAKPIAEQLSDFLYADDPVVRARVYSRMRGDAYLPPDGGGNKLPVP